MPAEAGRAKTAQHDTPTRVRPHTFGRWMNPAGLNENGR
jgi:hypothetical protein